MDNQKQPDKINFLNQDNIKPDIKQDFPEIPKKTGLPKWVTILIAVLVMAMIGIAGYFVYQYYFVSDEPVACTEEAKVCPDGSSVGRVAPDCEFAECPEVIDPTADWKIFQHNGWNYTISYPDNLYIKESPQGDKFPGDTSMCPMCGYGGQTLIISDIEKMGIQHVEPGSEKIHIVISTSKKEKNDSLYDYILKLTEGAENISQFTIDNITGYKILGGQESPISIWIVENENSEWVYSLYGIKTSTSENFELMMNILQTFKFIE